MSTTKGASISLQNVGYTINVPEAYSKEVGLMTKITDVFKGTKPSKDIPLLQEITGLIKPGRVTALIGPSGAGKSTLLDVISGRKNAGTSSGEILFNGKPKPKTFKRLAGYVEQADVLPETLSVREAILYTAQLKLDLPALEVAERVEKLIVELELQTCADSIVGSKKARGISGGQAKRVNIALEMVSDPSVLFLDEPTSGLDALTSANLMRIVRKLADGGRTVVVTIHQPSAEVFELVDDVVLLKLGRLAFWGSRLEALSFLQEATKLPLVEGSNPADFLLEALQVAASSANLDVKTDLAGDEVELGAVEKATAAGGKNPTEVWSTSPQREAVEKEVAAYTAGSHEPAFPEGASQFATSYLTELGTLTRRTFAMNARSPEFIGSRILGNLVIALVVGSLYWMIPNTQSGLTDLAAVCFFICAHLLFAVMQQLPVFLNGRPLVFRERSSGSYRVSTFLVSTIILELLFLIISVTIFTTIIFFMIDLHGGFGGWLELTIYCAISLMHSLLLSLMFSVLFPDVDTALAVAPLFLTLFILLSGFLIAPDSIPRGWKWVYYISPVRYGMELILNLEFKDSVFECTDTELVCNAAGSCVCPYTTGKDYLDLLGLDINVWSHIGVMLGMLVLFFFVSWALLRFKKTVSR